MRTTVATLAALLLAAAPATAAPARTAPAFSNDALTPYEWSFGPGTGFFSDALVASKAPCTQVLQTCDTTLVELLDPGTLTVQTATADKTLVDLDLYVFTSDADGTQGDQIGEAVTFSPAEALSVDVEPGFYLVRADYMTGAGSYSGTATFTPVPPEEEEPTE